MIGQIESEGMHSTKHLQAISDFAYDIVKIIYRIHKQNITR